MEQVWWMVFIGLLASTGEGHKLDYTGKGCEGQTFIFDCPRGYFLSFNKAFYGRLDVTTCISSLDSTENLNMTCTIGDSAALQIIKDECGRTDYCALHIGQTVFGEACPDTLKYMIVEFSCIEPDYSGLQCEGNKLSLECPDSFFISPHMSVLYGRQDDFTCSHESAILSTNCSSDTALGVISGLCGGKQACDLYVEASFLGDPCPGTYKYLEVDFTCSVCTNDFGFDKECNNWADRGECDSNADWMRGFCRKSCSGCDWREMCQNLDDDTKCKYWASIGECDKNQDFMHRECAHACNKCPPVTVTTTTEAPTTSTAVTTTSTLPPTTPHIPDGTDSSVACEGKSVHLTCPPGTALRVYSAVFGRTSNTICTSEGVWNHTDCYSPPGVSTEVRQVCDGRRRCSVGAFVETLGDACPGINKYLELHYICQDCMNLHGDDAQCDIWQEQGECELNRVWMYDNCMKSCSQCHYAGCGNIVRENGICDFWSLREECDINPGWMSENCKESCRDCPQQEYSCSPDCGHHGYCIAENTCHCDSGYSGDTCSQFHCDARDDCGTHGTCVGANLCACEYGWMGANCDEYSCTNVSDCNSQGRCIGPNVCLCDPYWSGTDCDECFVGFEAGPSCLPCPTCVHGSCNQDASRVSAYKGCYSSVDSSNEFSYAAWEGVNSASTLSCIQACLAANYLYAATTSGDSCNCGSTYSQLQVSVSCDLGCMGGQIGEVCGGQEAYSVWQTFEGSCTCDGENWAGTFCDTCSPGYNGTDCVRVSTTTTTTTPEIPPTASTVIATTQSSSPSSSTTSPSELSTSPSLTSTTTNATTMEASTTTTTEASAAKSSATTQPSTTSSQGSIVTSISTPSTVRSSSTLRTSSTSAPSETPSTIRPLRGNDIPMVVVLEQKWDDIYNDTENSITKNFILFLTLKLLSFYQETLPELFIEGVQVKDLRPGSVVVDHVILLRENMTIVDKAGVQCVIVQQLIDFEGQLDTEVLGHPEPELERNCAGKGDFCVNGADLDFDEHGYWICDCRHGYTGVRCENTVKDRGVMIVIIVVCLLVPLIVIVVICCILPRVCYKKQHPIDHGDNGTARSFEFHRMTKGSQFTSRKSTNPKLFHDNTSFTADSNPYENR